MDNLTHTLIGALVGEAVARALPRAESDLPEQTRRNLCVTLAAIGSNLPDSDLLYSFFGGKVNYLLHHRGHTHTILIALLLGAAVFGLTRWWLRRRNLQASSADLSSSPACYCSRLCFISRWTSATTTACIRSGRWTIAGSTAIRFSSSSRCSGRRARHSPSFSEPARPASLSGC